MNKSFNLFLLTSFSFIIFSGCDVSNSVEVNNQYSAAVQTTGDPRSNVNNISNQSNSVRDSFECVRSTPESILKESHFIESKFTLRKNEEYPFQMLGLETAKFKNGDRLTIENTGCENYTLVFRFETERFSGEVSDTRYWFRAASQLIEQTKKGIADDTGLVKNGTKALSSYIRKNKKPAFNAEIEFGGKEIRSAVTISEPIKRRGKTVEIEIIFGIGPL